MIHNYKVQFDENDYITGFYVPEDETQGDYEFDGSLLELDFLNAYKIVDNQPWLDEERNSTQDTIRHFISSCGIPEMEYIGSTRKKLDKADDYLKEIQQCIKDISYIDENLNALFNVEIVKYLQQKYKIGYYLE